MNFKREIECSLCSQRFTNNLGGQFTNHLLSQHSISLKDYVVSIEYNSNAPSCACGVCDEQPTFTRGAFKKYAKGHARFEARRLRYIEKNGQPTCKHCGVDINTFYRGKPRTYCSNICQGKDNGFSKPSTQQKILKAIREKYGVENVSHLPETKEKISKANIGKVKPLVSQDTRRKYSVLLKHRWGNQAYKQKMVTRIKEAVNTPEEKLRRSKRMTLQMKDPSFREKIYSNSKNKLSKLHQKVREKLDLESNGFVSEQTVGRYLIDELNKERKIIIEINGDYVHANPAKYQATDRIALRGNSYLAESKWALDRKKIEFLTTEGYKVFVIWESDSLDIWKNKLLEVL